ncbi:PD-(D/E)XK nuclease family protein [Myxococcus sp. XM-1-1-1]|uniref:PD-(D/E)XK nuclease family protein n=1 Tax=Myxococcus sp. XM-1-1-1 TaxID=2874602 RepID=UPI001CBD953C|nr:PD-(D/E)XK nuclease family protein [Myxococcus sp. XM-1-1-1]MBZ4414700.1 PD-(D/E)XK nuclease family protein [Myxococcus sp. XM-1-1-1]
MSSSSWTGQPILAVLGSKEEDRFTELLVHLLQAPEVLRAFMRELCGIEVSEAELVSLKARTQVTVPGGRPDIVIQGPARYCLFEAKVSSWLHEGQLLPYSQELQRWQIAHPGGKAHLFLLAPSQSSRGLMQTALQQLSQAAVTSAELSVLDWEKVAEVLAKTSEQVSSLRLRVYLHDFKELVAYRMGEPERPFTREEAQLLGDPLVARALLRARRLIGRIVSTLEEQNGGMIKSRRYAGPEWDGYVLRALGRWWWFGFWPDAWATAGESALVLQVPGFREQHFGDLPAGFMQPLKCRTSKNETWWVVPLVLREQVDLDILVAEHAATISAWMNGFPESGGLSSTEEGPPEAGGPDSPAKES